MTPELQIEIRKRIAELEPQERALWAEVQRIDAMWKPLHDKASDAWLPVRQEIEALKAVMPAEPQPEKAVPF